MVLFNVVAVVSLRWFATAAAAGPSSISLWILAGLFFFVPQGLAVSDLAMRYPDEGGVYSWTKRIFGEGHGFMCGWCYWVNNILYYPNLLMSTAVVSTYAIGRGETGLADEWTYILPATLVALWLATWVNVVGLKTGRWLQNVGAIGTYARIVPRRSGHLRRHDAPVGYTHECPHPDPRPRRPLRAQLWASIAFAFAGLELCAVMGAEVRTPAARCHGRSTSRRRSSPFSISPAPLRCCGSSQPERSTSSPDSSRRCWSAPGTPDGASPGSRRWRGPVRPRQHRRRRGVALRSRPRGVRDRAGPIFPPAFGRVHPRWKTPYVVIVTQAVLATLFLGVSVLGKGTTVEKAYLIILDTMLLVYFVPYIYLFLSYLKTARRNAWGA